MSSPAIRTLVIAKMPYPPIGGEHLRSWQNINILSQLGPVHVFAIFRHDYDTSNIETVESWHRYNVNQQPFPWRRIALFSLWIRKLGLWDHWAYRRAAAKKIDAMVRSLKPDLIVIEELWLYHYYLSVARRHRCPVIFDHHNVEAKLFEDTKCRGQGVRGWLRTKLHLPQVKADERAFMQHAAQTWVCSEHDKALLETLYDQDANATHNNPKRFVIPNTVNLKDYESLESPDAQDINLSPDSHRTVLYLGNFDYIPNAEAAELLIEQIYPRLQQTYPEAQLLLVGRLPTPFMLNAAQQNTHITVTGQVADIKPYLALGSVMVVPLRKGSGTRFKILEAFAAHRPVVSTAKGAEGLRVQDGQHLLIRESPEALAAGIVQIWQSPEQAKALTTEAYELVRADYSWEAAGRQVRQALNELFPQLSVRQVAQTWSTTTATITDAASHLPQFSHHFSIVIPTYARHQQLSECLGAIAQQNYPRDRFEVIVVNDGDLTLPHAIIEPYQNQLNIQLVFQPNSGPATARNHGASLAKGKFLAFTDDDCRPDPGWLSGLAAAFTQQISHQSPHKNLHNLPLYAVGGEVINALPDNLYSAASGLHGDAVYHYYNRAEGSSSFFASCNFAVPRQLYQQVGGFNPHFPIAAGEDREFCDRWLRNSYAMVYTPSARVYHAHALGPISFLKQHFNYGRGAFWFHQTRAKEAIEPIKTDLKFYWHLITYPFTKVSVPKACLLSALFVGCNVAKTVGFFWERGKSFQPSPSPKCSQIFLLMKASPKPSHSPFHHY